MPNLSPLGTYIYAIVYFGLAVGLLVPVAAIIRILSGPWGVCL